MRWKAPIMAAASDRPASLAEQRGADDVLTQLYQRTRVLHLQAEKTGILAAILRGTATRDGLLLLLRNLQPVYQALEQGLERHCGSPAVGLLSGYHFGRAGAIAHDLNELAGCDWTASLPLLPEGERYARRLAQVADGDGALLIAHAYTRYLGDLSGGQILRQLLVKSFGLKPEHLSMYEFPGNLDAAALKRDYREALQRAAAAVVHPEALIEEGALAFSHNIALSMAVRSQLLPRLVPQGGD